MYQRNRVIFIQIFVLNQIEFKLNDNCSSNTWNEDDDSFFQQLEKWGAKKIFSDQSEPVKRELRDYIEALEKL